MWLRWFSFYSIFGSVAQHCTSPGDAVCACGQCICFIYLMWTTQAQWKHDILPCSAYSIFHSNQRLFSKPLLFSACRIYFSAHIFFHLSHSLHHLDHRQNGIGISSMCARVGGVLAPMLQVLRGVSPQAPMVLCGLCPLLGSALTLLLPETANKHLPDTVEDVEGPDLRLCCAHSSRSPTFTFGPNVKMNVGVRAQ